MAFKMKGPSIHKGSAGHKSLIKAHQKQLRLNRSMDSTNLPDGRSKSSMFQMKSSAVPYTKRSMLRNEEDIKWGKEELISEEQYTTPEGVTGVEKIFTTQGVKTTTTQDPALVEFNKRCAKFGGVNSPEAAAAGCVWDESKADPKPIITKEDLEKKRVERTEDVPEPEPCPACPDGSVPVRDASGNCPCPEDEEKEKKWCHCKAYTQWQGGVGVQHRSWAKYECGTPEPPECTPPEREGGLRTGRIIEPDWHKKRRLSGEEPEGGATTRGSG